MTSAERKTKVTREGPAADTKQGDTALIHFIVNDTRETADQLHDPIFRFDENSSDSDISKTSSPALDSNRTSPEMTKDIVEDKMNSSTPINIPRFQITEVQTKSFRRTSPQSSVGDSVYDSPTLPRPSKDFNHVMIKLRRSCDIQRVNSYVHMVEETDSDAESSSHATSTSLPGRCSPFKGRRRTVRFDEATITVAAELGESAARFRSQWRKKRKNVTGSSPPLPRFGESKNISVTHDETMTSSPQLQRNESKDKSIFDVCNYSSYGRYT